MNWNREGTRINADYHDQPVSGMVVFSRVKYGGSVQHTVQLDAPIKLRWRAELTDTLLIDECEILEKSV